MNNFKIIKSQLSKILQLENDLINSIPWIQPVKIDDQTIRNDYHFIVTRRNFSFIKILIRSFYEILISISKIIRSLFTFNKSKNKKADFIILSHMINEKINNHKDFYFGDLQKNLKKNGYTSQMIYINHTKINKFENLNNENFLLPKIDNFYIELSVFIKQISLFIFSIQNFNKLYKKDVKVIVILVFILKTLSNHTQSALRIGLQIKYLIKNFSSKYLFFTFEGYCYEKSICIFNKNIKTYSYQNTPLNICQFSIQHYKKNSLPNIIFTKNEIYKNYLKKNLRLNCKFLNFGDLNYKKYNLITKKTKSNSILFIPEGNYYEVSIMIKFIENNFKINKNIKFTIRFHPIFPKEQINNFKTKFVNSKNVIFSEKSVHDDLLSNSFVIYRGSSLIFEAINAGLIPIYLDKGTNIDVLKILNISCNRIDFSKILNSNYLNNLSSNDNSIKLVNNLFDQENMSVLLKVL